MDILYLYLRLVKHHFQHRVLSSRKSWKYRLFGLVRHIFYTFSSSIQLRLTSRWRPQNLTWHVQKSCWHVQNLLRQLQNSIWQQQHSIWRLEYLIRQRLQILEWPLKTLVWRNWIWIWFSFFYVFMLFFLRRFKYVAFRCHYVENGKETSEVTKWK